MQKELMQFKLELTGPGINIKKEISQDLSQKIVLLIFSENRDENVIPESAPHSINIQTETHSQHSSPSHSLREFIIEHDAQRVPDKITAIGQYINKYRNTKNFNRANLIKLFEEAGEPVPKNISRDIKWALKIGWISGCSDNKSNFWVTNSGIKAIDDNFSIETKRKSRFASKTKRNK
jgi:hypothetical protein